jgi:hypothetical protein
MATFYTLFMIKEMQGEVNKNGDERGGGKKGGHCLWHFGLLVGGGLEGSQLKIPFPVDEELILLQFPQLPGKIRRWRGGGGGIGNQTV